MSKWRDMASAPKDTAVTDIGIWIAFKYRDKVLVSASYYDETEEGWIAKDWSYLNDEDILGWQPIEIPVYTQPTEGKGSATLSEMETVAPAPDPECGACGDKKFVPHLGMSRGMLPCPSCSPQPKEGNHVETGESDYMPWPDCSPKGEEATARLVEAVSNLLDAEHLVASIGDYTAPEQERAFRSLFGKAMAECASALAIYTQPTEGKNNE